MPFKKAVVVEPSGLIVEHWRVTARHFDDQKKEARVHLGGWTQKSLAVADKEPIYAVVYRSAQEGESFIDYQVIKGMSVNQLEEHIRTTKALFAGASGD